MKEIRFSKHFVLSEFTKSVTAERYYIKNNPRQEVIENLQCLVSLILEPAREQMGEPIVISSGYRCKKLNELVGGARNSQHMKGEAADISLPSAAYANKLIEILRQNPNVDQLLYEHKGSTVWVHVSCATDRKPRRMIRLNYKL